MGLSLELFAYSWLIAFIGGADSGGCIDILFSVPAAFLSGILDRKNSGRSAIIKAAKLEV